MPKSRGRKKSTKRASTRSAAVQEQAERQRVAGPTRAIVGRGAGVQNIAFSAMVALGFWGLALFCLFFYQTDPNHNIYGAIMGLTALGWSVIVIRRWVIYRQRV